MTFAELPHDERFFIRRTLEKVGCYIAEYSGQGVTVALPNVDIDLAFRLAEKLGLFLERSCYFPLGSDKPDKSLRHGGGYPGAGFWYYAHFTLAKGA